MTDSGKRGALTERLAEEISANREDLLSAYPLDKYISYLDLYPKIGPYRHLSPEVENYTDNILKYADEKTLELYHKLLLVKLILRADQLLEKRELPTNIESLYQVNFQRIVKNIESEAIPAGSYLYPKDRFFKDLGICCLRMIPAGVRKLHRASLPRSFLFPRRPRELMKRLIVICFELRGWKPLYTGHLDSEDPDGMAEFSPHGWDRHYRMVAELLKINQEIKGYFATSWFYDPELEKISPRLVYLRDLITRNGGKLFFRGASPQAVKDATFKSPTRRKLCSEGKYLPTNYLIVWPRKQLIEWADRSGEN